MSSRYKNTSIIIIISIIKKMQHYASITIQMPK